MNHKEIILSAVDDLVAEFLWYDRKEDEDLPRGTIQDAIAAGEVTIAEITAQFHASLLEGLT